MANARDLQGSFLGRIDRLLAKGSDVILRIDPATHMVDYGSYTEWRGQALTCLTDLLGSEHVYTRAFETTVGMAGRTQMSGGQGILRAVREDLVGGDLTDIRTLVSAEVFTDFLDIAEHFLDNGYKDPAALVCGAVLEDGLRRIATKADIPVKDRDDLSSLNHKCADKGIYSRLVQKKLQVLIDIRTKAAHAKFDEYKDDDVREMHKGVVAFLGDFLH